MLITTKTYIRKGIVMSHKHFTINERSKIEVLNKEGYSARKIAKTLGYHHSSISRELARCTDYYCAFEANQDNINKSKIKGRKIKLNARLKQYIENKLEETWSPEQIVGRDLEGIISFKSIYNWIYKGLLEVSLKVLRRKGRSRKPKDTRGKFNVGTSISNRPKHVKKRTEFGHWELDTIVSSRGNSKGCMATFAEMKTRMYVAIKMKDRSKDSMFEAMEQLTKPFSKDVFKSFTSDRGKEFACYSDVEKNLGIDFYFADPYCAWQRGTNENSNGLLREFYPKKTDLSMVKDDDLIESLKKINARPRKCLAFNTAFEEFLYEINNLY